MSLQLRIHNCRIQVTAFRQLSGCASKINISYYPAVMLAKHGPSRMSRFFHGKFSTVNGLPMDFGHISVCNTNVGITILKYKFFTKENDTISTQNVFLAANIPSNLKLFCKIHEYKHVDLMQGGGYFHDTTFRTVPDTATQAYFLFLFHLLINQIYVPHANVV